MKENISNNKSKELTFGAMAGTAGLALIALISLFVRSENNLTQARMERADRSNPPSYCEGLYGCRFGTEVLCDGNNTMFDLTDDNCEEVQVWMSDYSR